MTNMNNSGMTLADFERLLDIYGGDRTRWPADGRAAAAQLVSRDAKARRILAEAEALDRVLERAPLPSLAVEAGLAERIVAAAQRSPRIVGSAGEMAAAATAGAGTPAQQQARRGRRADLRAAALLAASLLVGIFIGASGVPQNVVPALADLASADRAGYSLAYVEPFDEDVL